MFSKTDRVTDSERFYASLFDTLDDPMEKKKAEALLGWWNQYVVRSLSLFLSHPLTHRKVFPHVRHEMLL